jgi:hypothetical protein
MAKAPLPGRAKTRLQPAFSAAQCAEIQAALIARTARWALDVAPGAAFVAHDPPEGWAQLAAVLPAGVEAFAQRGRDLGERLAAATSEAHARAPGRPLLVVGVDTRLTADHAREALEGISGGSGGGAGADVAFGPSLDGGYYLAALARPATELFGINPRAWGGEDVLELSLAAARAAGLTTALLEHRERDLDTPADAAALRDDPEIGHLLAPVLARQQAAAPA